MSVASLAQQLDELDAGPAFVTEAENVVTVSGVPTSEALVVARLCGEAGWGVRIEDREGNSWAPDDLEDDYAPFTVVIDKPAGPAGVLRILTNAGLMQWLGRGDARRVWQVARLDKRFATYATTFAPWGVDATPPHAVEGPRGARRLVREVGGVRMVPESVNPWLLVDRATFPVASQTAGVWAGIAARMLMLVLPDEVDEERGLLRFKGPPRLDLRMAAAGTDLLPALTMEGFLALQEAVDWTFELEREAEMRHVLLAAEFARSGNGGDAAPEFVSDVAADALAAARAAYQIQLAGMSSDALKTLSELRKSVSDDTAKVAEGTRQIITAVAGALAVGVGLVAARLSGTVNVSMIRVVLLLAAVYVAITILSGVSFTLLQRGVRRAWQPRLYRFLTATDYQALVGRPARTAERALWGASILGFAAIALMVIGFLNVEAIKKPDAVTGDRPENAPAARGGDTSKRMVGTGGRAPSHRRTAPRTPAPAPR